MGYAIAIFALLALPVLAAVAIALTGRNRHRHPLGEVVAPDRPAADAPTPDRSATSSPRQVEAARRHTPPA